ncbi:unnamed protein product [Rotaria sp. Silwood1]|nr:unnamed protein product [Rotaria sp. Silwood1]CAF3891747.1 unnamed protein product [Rotaria sp. Silwood1]CAF4044649.1 unnamed protein product [Rotaria sp. Silwood1]CAF4910901.1 unnamed protein product [Rotaria sp. Silwood1]CAF4964318.1 unnamed protein product [Rotaria sp. Silwood1]
MPKRQFYQQLSIEEAQYAETEYEDDHYEQFYYFLFKQLLSNIKEIPFDRIIQDRLQYGDIVRNNKQANSLVWLYTADRKFINSKTIYSFRFANPCHPEFYRTFETKSHHLFSLVTYPRHRYSGWYEYVGRNLLDKVDKYLNIERVVHNQTPHITRLFIHQNEERLDIQFNFNSIQERIVTTFEPGYPELFVLL